MSFLSNFSPWRKNLASWVFKILVLLFVISMASKIYLLSFPDLSLKERGFLFPPKVIRDVQRAVFEEKPTVLHNNSETQLPPTPDVQIPEIWRQPRHDFYYKCSQRSKKDIRTTNATDGYILINANGGLTQMRAGISDMVAIAHLMNATLVQPKLDHNSYWKDRSEFEDIFNWTKFVEVLKDDVTTIQSLPSEFAKRKTVEKAPISWSKANYYKWEMSRLVKRQKVISFTHTDSRLANNGLSGSVQRLRCRAMFESLQYTDQIQGLAHKFITSLRGNNTPYLALHLRYEKDILAFTGCTHNLTKPEVRDLTKMRRRTRHWRRKRINGEERRQMGACPMTPREVAVFLEALGFPNDTNIYIVAGDIYGQNGLQPLLAKFPKVFNHASLANKDELAHFRDNSNKLAAVDYMVAVESDVFIYTYDGHMAKAVKGHRLYQGFRKTISPDIRRFVRLIDQYDNHKMSWEDFSSTVKRLHKNSIGAPTYRRVGPAPRVEENFYANPYPGCICDKSSRW